MERFYKFPAGEVHAVDPSDSLLTTVFKNGNITSYIHWEHLGGL